MDSFEPNLPVFDRLRAIVLSRSLGSNEYSQQQLLDALEACKLEYARCFRDYGDRLSDDERRQYEREVESLDNMIEAEHARGHVPPTSTPEPTSSSPLRTAVADSSDVASERGSDTDVEDIDLNAIDPAMIDEMLDGTLDEDEPEARYVTLSFRRLIEADRDDNDGCLECPISREPLDVGQEMCDLILTVSRSSLDVTE
ncbi:hypothetical protein Slin15195_G032830 [Septoria linicola]|uniref:Uncharacterized protein n=1 Tax=Septoria linicola TaxID=215465 RepID=A0A9Q9EHF9_9PEZI|nr:hypothetical protein Slin15195_G032830 [Septoria linicola]